MAFIFSAESLSTKLSKLADTQDSIQTLSAYLLHQRKHASLVAKTWLEELAKVSSLKRLAYLHLANDVLQNSRRKGEEYIQEFEKIIPEGITITCKQASTEILSKVNRLVNIWDERKIFPSHVIQELKKRIPSSSSATPSQGSSKAKVALPTTYEPVPYGASYQSLKTLQKKRLLQGGEIATKIDISLTDANILNQVKQTGQTQDLNSKLDSSLKLIESYRLTMTEELQNREKLIQDLSNEILNLQQEQQDLGFMIKNIQTVENELNTSKQLLNE